MWPNAKVPHSEEGGRGTHTPGLQLGAGMNRITNSNMLYLKLLLIDILLTILEMNTMAYNIVYV